MADPYGLTAVAEFTDEWEAHALAALLRSDGIDAELSSNAASVTAPTTIEMLAVRDRIIRVLVPDRSATDARRLIEATQGTESPIHESFRTRDLEEWSAGISAKGEGLSTRKVLVLASMLAFVVPFVLSWLVMWAS